MRRVYQRMLARSHGYFVYFGQKFFAPARSPHCNRWRLREIAIAGEAGNLDFFTSGADRSPFDGLRDTGRGGSAQRLTVPATTLDQAWAELGCPDVSTIKIDVEGAEWEALLGSEKLLADCRPHVIFEWTKKNLTVCQRSEHAIFDLVPEEYHLLSVPFLTAVSPSTLGLELARTETYLLAPVTPISIGYVKSAVH